MTLLWDEPKRRTSLARRGIDFADLDEAFFLASKAVPAKDGRHMTIGRLGRKGVAVVFALLGSKAISIVSLRHEGRKKRTVP